MHIAFRDSMGAALGKVQILGDLNLDSGAVSALISKHWELHPACSDGQAKDAQDCLGLIRDEPLITPQGVSEDGRLQLVYSSFGP